MIIIISMEIYVFMCKNQDGGKQIQMNVESSVFKMKLDLRELILQNLINI